ncbi:MAG: BrnT family toxin [Verrucomicrobia bacterium]|nr:BrnT family toxin [Verrucomicrobiota bacterium]
MAQTVFLDENAIRFFDPDHSQDEDRFLMLGMSFTLRVLVVCHCYRGDDSVIRIISARKADKREQSDYWS